MASIAQGRPLEGTVCWSVVFS